MALQAKYYTQLGFEAPEAYVKITNFRGNKTQVNFDVEVFFNEEARDRIKQPVGYHNYEVPYMDGMSIQMLYNYLKSQPEFEKAVDV